MHVIHFMAGRAPGELKAPDGWLKWPMPGLNKDEALALADYLAQKFGWVSHYVE